MYIWQIVVRREEKRREEKRREGREEKSILSCFKFIALPVKSIKFVVWTCENVSTRTKKNRRGVEGRK
jgi:hypothetical protein